MKGGDDLLAVAVGARLVGVHEEDLRGGLGAEDARDGVEFAEAFPNRGALVVGGGELEHRVRAALRGEFDGDAL